ncbi:MAG: S24 family peptidase [Pseudomonadota bacterium]
MQDEVRRRLAELVREQGVTLAAASRAIGRNHAYLQQYLRRGSPRVLDRKAQEGLAAFFHVPIESFGGTSTPLPSGVADSRASYNPAPPTRTQDTKGDEPRAALHQPVPNLPPANASLRQGPDPQTVVVDSLPRNLPVLGSTVGGSSGDFTMNGDVIDYVRRPPTMVEATQAFALFVQGESMWPWRAAGSLVYLHPGRLPRPGDHVVVELYPEDDDETGERPCYVKRLVSRSGSSIQLAQYNPPRDDIHVPVARVRSLYRVMEWEELLGI